MLLQPISDVIHSNQKPPGVEMNNFFKYKQHKQANINDEKKKKKRKLK